MCILSACATQSPRQFEQVNIQPPKANNQLTQGNVQMNLLVGETRKSDVLDVFGAPNVTTRDGSGVEVWSYQRYARVAQSEARSNAWSVLLGGLASDQAAFSETMRTMTLIIRFDEKDVVSDFRSRASEF
ncbi:hypothetical protein IP81_02420 [Novosphingobium sp. AAP83]|nr:hypothetical protein IP81_02420 [Novosphingobium sp. AAP83]